MNDESRWRDWASNAKSQIQKRRDEDQKKSDLFVAEQDLKKAHAPKVWASIRKDIEDMCRALNAEMGREVIASESPKMNEVKLRAVDSGVASIATFDPSTMQIETSAPGAPNIYTASVSNGQFVFKLADRPVQPHEIAKRFLDSVVNLIR